MEKVSAKTFFTVLWRGVCQALGWFFGLFGYKRNGKFAKCVWGLFATSAAIFMFFITSLLIYVFGREYYKRHGRNHHCEDPYCYESISSVVTSFITTTVMVRATFSIFSRMKRL